MSDKAFIDRVDANEAVLIANTLGAYLAGNQTYVALLAIGMLVGRFEAHSDGPHNLDETMAFLRKGAEWELRRHREQAA